MHCNLSIENCHIININIFFQLILEIVKIICMWIFLVWHALIGGATGKQFTLQWRLPVVSITTIFRVEKHCLGLLDFDNNAISISWIQWLIPWYWLLRCYQLMMSQRTMNNCLMNVHLVMELLAWTILFRKQEYYQFKWKDF